MERSKAGMSFSLVFRFTSAFVFLPYRAGFSLCTCSCTVGKKRKYHSVTIGNEELMHECFPKLAHGNIKKEIRQKKIRRKEEMREHGKK